MNLKDLSVMAWRNMFRNKRRTFLTAFSVAFGVLLSVTFTASGDYSYTNLINTSATMGFGHLAIEPPGFNDYPTLAKRLADGEARRQRILEVNGVEAAYVRIVGQAIFATGSKSIGGQFIALDPVVESATHNVFLEAIEQGSLFAKSDSRGVVIGVKMAEKLKLRIGKKLIYTVTDKDGELVSGISRVSGIFRIGDDSVDSSVVLLPIDRMRSILNYDMNDVSVVSIFIKNQRKAEAMLPEIRTVAANGEAEVLTWKDTQAELAGLIAIDRASNYLLQFLVGLLIAAGIFNTLLMSVLERKREFGMMMAVGMSPGRIVVLVMSESFWIGLGGLILGVLITTPWFIYMQEVGINFSSHIGDDYSAGGVLVDPVLKFRLFRESAIAILVGVFSLTMLAGIYPAVKAGLVPPIESLKML